MKQCYLVGAGEFAKERFKPEKNAYIIAVDGGINYLEEIGYQPDLFIGDMDSVKKKINGRLENPDIETFVLPVEKNETDMLAAIYVAMDRGYDHFFIHGSLGMRFDHSMANISCLVYLKNHNCKGYLIGKNETIEIIEDETRIFEKEQIGKISIFPLEKEAIGVTLIGLKYPLNQYLMKMEFPIGVSNEFIGEKSKIIVEKGKLLLIY